MRVPRGLRPALTRRVVALGTLAALLASCNEPPAPPARPGVVLEIDGIVVEEHELEPLLDYIRQSGDRIGRAAAVRAVLDRHVLPLRFAQREFAAQRAELAERATAFRRSVEASGNADPQLRSKGAILGGEPSGGLIGRSAMELAQAAWCFVEENLGQVSPVIEVPRGFCVMSVADYQPGLERSGDLVDAYQVPFYTHDKRAFSAWWDERKRALAGKLTWVNPEYADALPTWLR
ncbi:MAG TPA: hypothetical protein VK081_09190 [Planctomycetota bacterium]|nr:hypothetical protein [Planctomycetota bacterium]